jgi:hypothetical protein
MPLRTQQAAKSYRVAFLALAGDQDAVIVVPYSRGRNRMTR